MPALSPLLLRAGLRHLWHHRWQGFLALSGIALGVAVVLAVDLASQAARMSFRLSAAQLQGEATHRMIGHDGKLPESLYTHLKRQPGCPPMAPVVTGRVQVTGQAGGYRLTGVDLLAEAPFRRQLAAVAYRPDLLRAFLTRPGAMVLTATAAQALGVRVGDRLEVGYRGRSSTLKVLSVAPVDAPGSRDLLFVDVATAQSVLAMAGYLTHIDLILDAAAEDWIRARLPAGVDLVTATGQAQGMTRLSAAFELNLTAMSLLALLVGAFLVFNAMMFSVVQRRTLLGRLRAVGVTPRELLRLLLVEAVVVGLAGTVIGLLGGAWLSRGLVRLVAATINELYYQTSVQALYLDPVALLKAGTLGMAVTLLATLIPAREAAATPPLTTLSRVALEQVVQGRVWRLAGAGLVLLVAGLLVALAARSGVAGGFVGLFLLVIGAALTTPAVIRGLRHLPGSSALPLVWRMGMRDLDRHLSRLGVAVAALMVALAAAVGVGVMVDSMRGSVDAWLGELLSADLYVAAAGHRDGAVLPAAVVRELSGLPVVCAASRYHQGSVHLAQRQVGLIGAHLSDPSRQGFELLSGNVSATWQDFDRGGLLISEPLAWHLGLERGAVVQLPTAAGTARFTVAGIFRDYASEHGRIFMDESTFLEHWPGTPVDSLALFAAGGDVARLRRSIDATFAGRHDLTVTPARVIHDESLAVFDRTFRITGVLRALLLIVAFIGVFGALMALQLERGKEFAIWRALGMRRIQIAGLIGGESLLMGFVAACLAIPAGLLMAWLLIVSVQRRAFGWTMALDVNPWLLLQVLLVGLIAAALAAVYPLWRSALREPATLLREE